MIKRIFKYGVLSLLLLSAIIVTAETQSLESINARTISVFKKYSEVLLPKIVTPTVVEIAVPNSVSEEAGFLVYDKTTQDFEPSLFKRSSAIKTPIFVTVTANGAAISSADNMGDFNLNTFTEIPLVGDSYNSAVISITTARDINTDSLSMILDNYVALPKTISIKVGVGAEQKTVLAETEMLAQTVHFPMTSAKQWTITARYGQPLRITELYFVEKNLNSNIQNSLRFLAQPDHNYQVFLDADRSVRLNLAEAGNLSDNQDIGRASFIEIKDNPGFVISDTDADGIPDIRDNCVSNANPDQADINQNGRGDVCDDFDKDGVINSKDNCTDQPNFNQLDTDGDKIGDVCDGEESRITEKYPWLPWLGIGLAIFVVVVLFALTAISMRKKDEIV